MNGKRILALVLTLTLCLGVCSVSAAAADEPAVSEDASVGRLIADMLDGESAADASAYGGITDITVTGKTARVRFHTAVPAELVAAIYDEQGEKLLGSGHVLAAAGEDTVSVPIEIDEMPAYFVAGAYLLDAETHEPLCEPRLNRMYTQALQDLTNSTISDYDPDRVLNLDGDPTTNFLVFGDRTVGYKAADGVTVVNNGGGSYTVPDAPEHIRAMQPGDSLVYLYEDGSSLVFAVRDVSVNGSDVTLTEDTGASLTDVFSFVKIDTVSARANGPQLDGAMDAEGGGSVTIPLLTKAMQETASWKNKYGTSLSGSVDLVISVSLQIYASHEYKHVRVEANCELVGSVELSQEVSVDIPLAKLSIPTEVPGVYITLTPSLVMSFNAALSLEGTLASVTAGFEYDSDTGAHLIDSAPTYGVKPKAAITFYVGLRAELAAVVLNEGLCKAGMTGDIGVRTAVVPDGRKISGGERHDCYACLTGTPSLEIGLSAKLDFIGFRGDRVPEIRLKPLSVVLNKFIFYYSGDHEEFGWGICPYKTFLVTVHVKAADGSPADDAVLYGAGRNTPVTSGRAELYLAPGTYTLNVLKNDTFGSVTVTVVDRSREASVTLAPAEMIDSGVCGDNITWRLYSSGMLVLEGTGATYNYNSTTTPFYKAKHLGDIKFAVVGDGISGLGNNLFCGCSKMTNVSLPSSLSYLGDYVFYNCINLTEARIPSSVTALGAGVFYGCRVLPDLRIPDSVTSIGDWAFQGCLALTSMVIPDSVEALGKGALRSCDALEAVVLSKSLTKISDNTFENCFALKRVELPDSVTSIGKLAFYRCSGLEAVLIPDRVTSIGQQAFGECEKLYGVVLPPQLESIGDKAFEWCRSLTSVTIPGSVKEIPLSAFYGCTSLTSATILPGPTSIKQSAFGRCDSLTALTVPGSVKTVVSPCIDSGVQSIVFEEGVEYLNASPFENCAELKSITLPASIKALQASTFDYNWYGSLAEHALRDIWYGGTQAQWKELWPYESDALKNVTVHCSDGDAMQTDGAAEEAPPEETADPAGTEEPLLPDEPEPEPDPVTEPGTAQETEPETEAETEPVPEPGPEAEASGEADGVLLADALAVFTGSASPRDGRQAASFTGLKPGGQYAFLAVKDPDAAALLAPENLLFIAQGTADESGALSFVFIPRTDEAAALRAYGPSDRDLADAAVTVQADGTVIVIYNGEVLLEGRDFTDDDDGVSVTVTGLGQYGGRQSVFYGNRLSAARILQAVVGLREGGYTPADAAEVLKG